jgi:signal transduction histidine kinase
MLIPTSIRQIESAFPLSLRDNLEKSAIKLVELGHAVSSSIWLWDETHNTLQIQASYNLTYEYLAYANQMARLPIDVRERVPVYRAYRLGIAFGSDVPFSAGDLAVYNLNQRDYPVQYIYVAPIVLNEVILGTVALYYTTPQVVMDRLRALEIRLLTQQIATNIYQATQQRFLNNKLSELEQANQLLHNTVAELKVLDRLKNDLLNAAWHELRTPLTTMLGFAELLRDGFGGPLAPLQRDYVSRIQEGGQRLNSRISDLVDLAEIESGSLSLKLECVNLVELISEVLACQTPQLTTGLLNLESTLPATNRMMRLDGRRIAQVIQILLDNAIKFTPSGGKITVRLLEEALGVRIEVHDTGIGIAAETLPLLFEKFYQADFGSTRPYGGTGLGLAIAKVLMEAHGGTIGAASAPGTGSTFWLTLPFKD